MHKTLINAVDALRSCGADGIADALIATNKRLTETIDELQAELAALHVRQERLERLRRGLLSMNPLLEQARLGFEHNNPLPSGVEWRHEKEAYCVFIPAPRNSWEVTNNAFHIQRDFKVWLTAAMLYSSPGDAITTAERDELAKENAEQRLKAAEQRNSILTALLQRAYDADLAARHRQPYNTSKLMDDIEIALKPTESGAS